MEKKSQLIIILMILYQVMIQIHQLKTILFKMKIPLKNPIKKNLKVYN